MLSRTFKLIVTSARTRMGQFSPILGFATSTTVKETMGCAILAHPPKTTPPYSDNLKKKKQKKPPKHQSFVRHYLITDSVLFLNCGTIYLTASSKTKVEVLILHATEVD